MNLKKIKMFFSAISFSCFVFAASGCGNDFETVVDLSNSNYSLLNQDSVSVNFPSYINGNIGIVSYIFTNCPDICPLTTNNMRLIKEELIKENINGIKFVSISFDPEVDKPHILKKFAEMHSLDLSNWDFLTGDKNTIKKLLKKVGVIAFVGDSTVFEDGRKTYYYTHTDRIQLMDRKGRVVKNYSGSGINLGEIVNDVKQLN
jgi:protein SCO1/2